MFQYNVEFNVTHYYSYHSGEQYGDWSEESDQEIISITPCDNYPDIVSSMEIKDGETCYVVWVQWGSGDSFGFHSGAYAEAFGVFKSKCSAEQLATALRKASVDEEPTMELETEDGQKHKFYCLPFIGYFDRVDFIEVAEMRMGSYGNKRY